MKKGSSSTGHSQNKHEQFRPEDIMSLPLSPLKDLAVDLFQVASTAPAAQTADKTNATRICGLSTQQRRTCIGRRQSEPSGLDSSTANTREPARAKETTSAGGRTVTNQRFKDTADNDDAPDARRRHRRQRGCARLPSSIHSHTRGSPPPCGAVQQPCSSAMTAGRKRG